MKRSIEIDSEEVGDLIDHLSRIDRYNDRFGTEKLRDSIDLLLVFLDRIKADAEVKDPNVCYCLYRSRHNINCPEWKAKQDFHWGTGERVSD